ncbi:ribosome biogenesis GTP-binding protein YihA/YsxC [Anoxynatronum buryatiense]|uniref:Probable GTP-binding protein EngB n=1 Tax=Anoxynatronum buryatiense TaxID=489973 RepID=A0AA45WWR9_9CLOT|nr:ribosome biogenesis GTP-binding protein YihA/YsxC [Anoxynatronum buryatiense]SMP61291.1 GTP-binding protein [Anoxynatronum buryatiense]
MIIKEAAFVGSFVKMEQYPVPDMPEIAMAGRSNVGKSSLINTMLNRKKLAKTSSTPGKTRTINFYKINQTFYLVDLPGYGYAKVSKKERESWGGMIGNYLSRRTSLQEVVLLVDCRHDPSGEDKQMYEWIQQHGFGGVVIATKADKLSRSKLTQQLRRIRNQLGMPKEAVILPVSSLKKEGSEAVWEALADKLKPLTDLPDEMDRDLETIEQDR